MLTEKSKRSSYRFDPSRYEVDAYRNLGGSLVSDRELSDIVQSLNIEPGSLVLDVGMGPGRVMRRLAAMNAVLVGIDADARMVRHFARLKSTVRTFDQDDTHLIVASAEYLPFRESVFEGVVCIRVLRYLEQPRRAIWEMCHVLGPSGRLVLEFANRFRPQTILQIPGFILKGSVYPRVFTRRTVFGWVAENGIDIQRFRGWHRVPVEIMGAVRWATLARILTYFDWAFEKILPPEFMSRSLVVSGAKNTHRATVS